MAVELLPGIGVGHVTHDATGVTAVACPAGAFAAVDVRGGGPGTRETDLLEAHNTVQQVHAVMLAGGSAYGLAAADGAMQELERQGIGFKVLVTPQAASPRFLSKCFQNIFSGSR